MGCQISKEYSMLNFLNENIPKIQLFKENINSFEEQLIAILDKTQCDNITDIIVNRSIFNCKEYKDMFVYNIDSEPKISNELLLFTIMSCKWNTIGESKIDSFILNIFPLLDHNKVKVLEDSFEVCHKKDKDKNYKSIFKRRLKEDYTKEEKLMQIITNKLSNHNYNAKDRNKINSNCINKIILELLINHCILLPNLVIKSFSEEEKIECLCLLEDYFSLSNLYLFCDHLTEKLNPDRHNFINKNKIIDFFIDNQFIFYSKEIRFKVMEYVINSKS